MSELNGAAIEVHNLHRSFGNLKAVDGVTFRVEHGQVIGFVGANGAGKTTTMRILATLDYPTAGRASICGIDVVNYPGNVRRMLGWMPDSFGTYDHMTVVEYLDFFARALGFRGEERHARVTEVMDFADLGPLADRLINKLSKGMGQRLCLGRSLLHDPRVLILDEPAAGLDPKARVELKHLIRILAEEGKTIFISSHILSELAEMCDSLLFINKGRIVHHGSAEELTRAGGDQTVVRVELHGDPQKLSDWAAMSPYVEMIDASKNGGRLRIDSGDPEKIGGVLKRMVTEGLPVVDFHREERRLEDAFIDLLGKLEAEDAAAVAAVAAAQPPPPVPGEGLPTTPKIGAVAPPPPLPGDSPAPPKTSPSDAEN
ncbi:MAG: ABC transporter ATP-binding protein [Verrucomicrobiales bacterium]